MVTSIIHCVLPVVFKVILGVIRYIFAIVISESKLIQRVSLTDFSFFPLLCFASKNGIIIKQGYGI